MNNLPCTEILGNSVGGCIDIGTVQKLLIGGWLFVDLNSGSTELLVVEGEPLPEFVAEAFEEPEREVSTQGSLEVSDEAEVLETEVADETEDPSTSLRVEEATGTPTETPTFVAVGLTEADTSIPEPLNEPEDAGLAPFEVEFPDETGTVLGTLEVPETEVEDETEDPVPSTPLGLDEATGTPIETPTFVAVRLTEADTSIPEPFNEPEAGRPEDVGPAPFEPEGPDPFNEPGTETPVGTLEVAPSGTEAPETEVGDETEDPTPSFPLGVNEVTGTPIETPTLVAVGLTEADTLILEPLDEPEAGLEPDVTPEGADAEPLPDPFGEPEEGVPAPGTLEGAIDEAEDQV
ncbi:hypothetical protein BT96DRAFT_287480 [Gymnopus androsaceus JB14]|uniref:Uncharacterized protein n=1 Tax=Gymnopus androsaceus JB14 TaxID=1447944 RepID=A0A6A4H4T9_9AGAR|nr:hypothetical protein BT96DRAFT_287480 [Gymnopus androsaceus JB14]